MQHSQKRISEPLFLVVGTLVFMICDSRGALFTGQINNFVIYFLFIAVDFTYFYLGAFFILPRVEKIVSPAIYRVLFVVLVMAAYSYILAHINLLVRVWKHKPAFNTAADWWASFSRSLQITVYFSLFWYVRYSRKKDHELQAEKAQKATLERQALEQQNRFLKMQLEAHSWNNSLTSLYMMSVRENPELAEGHKILIKLARYSLESSNEAGLVTLKRDIAALQDLISLYKWLAREKAVYVQINISLGDSGELMFPPKLMTSFVENLFKYGDIYDLSNPASIDITCTDGLMIFSCSNKKFTSEEEKQSAGYGIGIKNTIRRLEGLLPGRHNLMIHEGMYEYVVTLKLLLS